MRFFILSLIQIFFFVNLSANEINLNDPFYKLGWKNLESPKISKIQIPNANASLEIIETEIYLNSKEDIKNYQEYLYGQEFNIDDIDEKLIISDKDQYYKIEAKYYDEGYISTDRYNNFKPSDLLEAMNKNKSDSIEKFSWALEPTLSENKISTYGYKVDWKDGDITYWYYGTILGRNGYVELKMTLYGDTSDGEDFFNFYNSIIKEISSTVEFDEQYKYSDFSEGDYLSSYTLTNIIDGSWGEGAAADLTNIVANCLITTGALKKGNIAEADHSRFAGKVINFYISDVRNEIMDLSLEDEVNVISGMYGIQDKQNFQKLNISSSNPRTYDISYTNIIEVVGDKVTDKSKYEYKNKLVIKDGVPKLLFAKIDQTGLSFNKWNLTLGCQDKEYSDDEITAAKSTSTLLGTTKPEWFDELAEKILKERGKTIDGGKIIDTKKMEDKAYSNYSLLIEQDAQDYMIVYRYPVSKEGEFAKGTYIYNSKSDYAEFFEQVYKNGPSNNLTTSIQQNKFNIDGELEDYISTDYILDDFNFSYSTRMGDYILNFETATGGERILSYISNKESFSLGSYLENEAWHASTFKILASISDFKNLAKNNPDTLCNILWEPLIKNLSIKELNNGNLEDELNKNGINNNSLECK